MTKASQDAAGQQISALVEQMPQPMHSRRFFFAVLVVLTIAALGVLMVATLSRGGYSLFDFVFTICFLVTLPWTVIGFWNAVIGLLIMRLSADPSRTVCPVAANPNDNARIITRTALLMCVRNEDARSVSRNLNIMIKGLVEAGMSDYFHVYILSDSSWKNVIEAEQRIYERLQHQWRGVFPVTYRRRDHNEGFKAGNIRNFCDRWGEHYDYALVLDADSLMSTKRILRLVRTMQINPQLGILQSLVVGMPTVSIFARMFQFGMRLGMRSYTLGSAWWQADCGPYWGHNAIIRLKPFIRHCHLPKLPGRSPLGGWILSHDQVEAVLMRRAGYEVRVLPEEGGSWEETPATLLEFMRRDLRWCHGNMQYWRLLCTPGLLLVSRIQLLLAILMYLSAPAWIVFMMLGIGHISLTNEITRTFHPDTGIALFVCIMIMVFAPKLATLADVLASSKSRQAFGGTLLVLVSTIGEIVFFTLLAPIMAFAHTRFLIGLPLGHVAAWSAQRRSSHQVPLSQALTRLWPQTFFGGIAVAWLMLTAPAALVGFMPFLLGSVFAVPLAVLTSGDRLGSLSARVGLWCIPDETAPASDLQDMYLPALRQSHLVLAVSEPVTNTTSGK